MTARTPRLIDGTTGTHAGADIVQRIYLVGDAKVRVRVHRDSYARQSWALAEVLTPALTWTEIAVELSGNWHGTDSTGQVADKLIARAAKILA
jgi:hypothetical protein